MLFSVVPWHIPTTLQNNQLVKYFYWRQNFYVPFRDGRDTSSEYIVSYKVSYYTSNFYCNMNLKCCTYKKPKTNYALTIS